MPESDEIERIRRQKRETLLESTENSETEDPTNSPPVNPIHVDGATELQEIVAEYPVVFLEFYADWCGPCEMLEPVLEDLAASTDAAIAKVDIDSNQDLAASYNVRGVPTMVLFDDGEVVEQLTGARDQSALERLIDRHTE